jgi:hypothetical protein
MPPAIEARADAALVAVLTQDGYVRGTGFVIDDNGTVLTCHHVVDGLEPLRLRGPDGSTHVAGSPAIVTAPEIDLALIRTEAWLGTPLPLVSEAEVPIEYWTKGFHRLSEEIRAGFPVQGRIIGTTSVSYASGIADYDLDDVFVLRDDAIDVGLSGAPVLDLKAGAVVAVVNTRLVRDNDQGGFAVPIGHAFTHPALAWAVKLNQATIPVYGPYLNGPAARELCAAVTASEIENLTQLRRVDLTRRVPRADIEDATARFLATDAPVFALVGPSGVGKSTEIAAVARRLPGRALLLRGSSLRPDSTSLGEAIEAALARASGGSLLPRAADMAVAAALRADAGLVVLLDALNEAPMNGQAFEEWIASTRSWLRQTTAQLIVSCRPELWGDLVGRPLSSAIDHRQPVVVTLGGFTNQEFAEAAHAYGLPPGVDWPILHLPLALSLITRYEERPTADRGTNSSINEVVEKYVEEAARRLVKTPTGPPQSAQLMRDRLVQAAAQMWERDTDALSMQSFSEIFGTSAIADSVVLEGVMSSTPSGYRFVYDDVGDWLQAQSLDLDGELTAIARGEQGSWRHVAPVASALRDVERRDGAEALRTRLIHLIENAATDDTPALTVAESTLLKVGDARPYAAVLDRMVHLITGSDDFIHYSITFWRTVPVPFQQRIDLLQRLVPADDSYYWRPKDWHLGRDSGQESGRDADSFSILVYQIVYREPALGITALLPWLDDVTPLRDREARVADVAMGIFYQLRRRQEHPVWSAMTKAGAKCQVLIRQLAVDDPEWLAHMVTGEYSSEADDELVIFAALRLEKASLPDEVAETVGQTVARRYSRGLAPELRGTALAVLTRGDHGSDYLGALIEAYKSGELGADEWTLGSILDEASDVVLPLLVEALGQQGERRERALAVLARSSDTTVQAVADRAVRHQLETALGVVDFSVCRYAEERLYRTAVAGEDLLAVVRQVIAAPSGSGRKILIYPLTSPRALHDPAQRAILLQEFIDTPGDPRAAQLAARELIWAIVENPPLRDGFGLLRHVLSRLSGTEADKILIRAAALRSEDFADVLAHWLTTGALTPFGTNTRQLKERVEAGEEPASAADQIMQARMNRLQ